MISVNQLRIYGAVADWCEELAQQISEKAVILPSEEHVSCPVRRHCGSSRDPSPRLEFSLLLPSRNLFAVYVAWPMLLVVLSSSVGRLAAPVRVRSQWWTMGAKLAKLGRSQPRAGHVKRLSRAPTSLCPTSYLPEEMGRRFHQPARIQSWKTARSLTNPKSTGRSKQTTSCGKFSRQCKKNTECSFIYGDCFQSKMQ